MGWHQQWVDNDYCKTCNHYPRRTWAGRCVECWSELWKARKAELRARFGDKVLRYRTYISGRLPLTEDERYVVSDEINLRLSRWKVEMIVALHKMRRESEVCAGATYYILKTGDLPTWSLSNPQVAVGFAAGAGAQTMVELMTVFIPIEPEIVAIANECLKMKAPAWTTHLNVVDSFTPSQDGSFGKEEDGETPLPG